jgi:microsomal dipeptidase-like Zn-dependent dipeptidase
MSDQSPDTEPHASNSRWKELHKESTVVDLHNHIGTKASYFKWFILIAKLDEEPKGEFDPFSIRSTFDRLSMGGVDVCLSAAYVPEKEIFEDIAPFSILGLKPFSLKDILLPLTQLPIGRLKETWDRLIEPTYFEATCNLLEQLEETVKDHAGTRPVRSVRSYTELESALKEEKRPIAILHSVEGAHSLQDKTFEEYLKAGNTQGQEDTLKKNLKELCGKGAAYLTLAHFYPNHVAPPTFPYPPYAVEKVLEKRKRFVWRDLNCGLEEHGEAVVTEMIDLGMLIDVTHCTPKARQQIYHIVEERGESRPVVVATHVGAYEINPMPYNLEDWEIKWISENGGVVGCIFMNHWLTVSTKKFGLDYISKTIEHMVNVGGVQVAAFGTDFDGFTDPPDEVPDPSHLERFTQRLTGEYSGVNNAKYQDDDVANILGGNMMRVLKEGWVSNRTADHS